MSEGDGNILNLNPTKLCSGQRCECSHKPKGLEANKEDGVPVKGFTKITHEKSSKRTFTLPKDLDDGSAFVVGPIPTAKKVEAYYWPGRPTRPLLLVITTTNEAGNITYYTNDDGYKTNGVGGGIWNFRYGINQNDLVKWLDYLNCQYNKAIPIDLKDPGNLSRFYPTSGRGCLNGEEVTGPSSPDHVPTGYEAKVYSINPEGTYISRVLYGDQPTDIGTPVSPTRTIRVYTWTKEEDKAEDEKTPLLVELKTNNNEYYYHKNKGTSNNTSWESANKDDKTERIGPELTKLLDGARCNLFNTFKVELSKDVPYRNNECSKQQIQVAPYRDNPIENYTAYKHTHNERKEFVITEFTGTDGKQDFDVNYPIRKVKEVVVYTCSREPLLVYINSTDPSFSKEWHQYNKSSRKWTAVSKPNLTTSSRDDIIGILDGIQSPCGPPSVIIDISKGPGEENNSSEYYSPGSSGKKIKVTKVTSDKDENDPPLYYDRYDHTVEGREASYFTLEKVVCGGDTHVISQIKKEEAATLVSVYYWSHGEDIKGKPLLVKVESRQQKSDPKETTDIWYENTGGDTTNNTIWQKVTEPNNPTELTGTKLKNKLDLLNCKLNNVVVVDASKKDKPYCHDDPDYQTITLDSSHPHKLKVEEESSSKGKLATYKAYVHSNTSSGKPFHIVCIKVPGQSNITLDAEGTEANPILSVSKVIFYFCQDKLNIPLFIYYQNSTHLGHNWYNSDDGNTWKTLPEWSENDPTSEANHSVIVDELDEIGLLRNPCRPAEVTIDIKNGPNREKTYGNVSVTSDPVDDAPNYTEYKHTPQNKKGREYFTITQVNYKNQMIDQISPHIQKVQAFNVYYWDPLKDKGNPLLIKIEKQGNDADWYENTGTNANNTDWSTFGDPSSLTNPDNLKKKLILLNCKLNNVTSINIAVTPSKEPPAYCHEEEEIEESHIPKLIQVTDVTNELYQKKLGSFVVYQHSLSSEAKGQKPHLKKFHISDFKKDGTVIQLGNTPVLKVPKVLVYFCDKDPTKGKPLLIHFTHSVTPYGEPSKQEWYQRMNDGSKTTWKAVENGIPKGENDIPAIYAILNNYATSCKDDTLLRILLGTAAGSAGGGATTYGVYEMIRWLFMSPWPRLM